LKVNYGIMIEKQHGDAPLYSGPIQIDFIFYFPVKLTLKPEKRLQYVNTFKTSRPDLDNLIKFILDAATGILYHDDSIITAISAKKIYALEGKTEFTVRSAH